MKILIVHPDICDPGGVSNYFSIMDNYFNIHITHFINGKRIDENHFFSKIIRLIRDYILFIKVISTDNYDLVHLNPSLDYKSVLRDGIFVIISKLFRKKILIFFHGWDINFANKLLGIKLRLFKSIYGKADMCIVLAKQFKNQLLAWGFNKPIKVETTIVDDKLLEGINIETVLDERIKGGTFRILFLARIIKDKGIYETIKAFRLLKKKYSNMELVIAGDGDELKLVKEYVSEINEKDIIFVGYLKGELKKEYFKKSNIYILPSYREGMPISIVEAMAFGLPIITRPVGGLADFSEQNKHGFITESMLPEVFAKLIEKLFLDKKLYCKISLHNYYYAQKEYLATKVIKRIENTYEQLIRG